MTHSMVTTDADAPPVLLSLMNDVPALTPPVGPTDAEIDALPSVPDLAGGVPAGVPAGPTDLADLLGDLVTDVEVLRRRLAAVSAEPGFLVSAADQQRHRELTRLAREMSSILAERA